MFTKIKTSSIPLRGANAKVEKLTNIRSIDFDGSGDYLDVGVMTTPLVNDGSFCIGGWVKFDAVNAVASILTKKHNDSNRTSLYLNRSGKLVFAVANGGSAYALADSASSADTWYHIIGYYNGAGADDAAKIKIYVDGAEIAVSHSGTIQSTSSNDSDYQSATTKIGAGEGDFNGQMHDISVWSNILTANAIKDLYSRGKWHDTKIPITQKSAGYSIKYSNTVVSNWRMGNGSHDDIDNGLILDEQQSDKKLSTELLADGNMQAAGITSWDEHAAGDYEVPYANLSKDTSIYRSGSQSLRINCATYPEAGVLSKITSMSTSTLYKWTGWFRADSDVAGGNGVDITGDYDGGLAGDMDISLGTFKTASGNLTADTWTQFTHYFVPTGTTVYFGCWIRTAGIVHFDDWSVKAVNGNSGILTGNPVVVRENPDV